MRQSNRTSSILLLWLGVCAFSWAGETPVSKETTAPGTTVHRGDKEFHLQGSGLEVGKALPEAVLTDGSLKDSNTKNSIGKKVLLISVVPSIDTPVCEKQTHILSEEGKDLPDSVERLTISRDLPFAQKRFAKESGLENITYLSDFKEASFGKATGLLLEDLGLLARGAIVVDKNGVVRYFQIVPELTHLPDMETAFKKAKEVAGKDK